MSSSLYSLDSEIVVTYVKYSIYYNYKSNDFILTFKIMFEFAPSSATGLHITLNTSTLEAGNIGSFKESFEDHCPSELDEVTVDMSQVQMIDSSGIGALLGIQKRLSDGKVRLQRVNATVLSVIELLRLHQVFDLEVNANAASEAS